MFRDRDNVSVLWLSRGDRAIVNTRNLGSYEQEIHATDTVAGGGYVVSRTLHRHRLGAVVLTHEQVGQTETSRMAVNLTDYIGSEDVVLRFDWNPATGTWKAGAGQVAGEKQSYNAWGERRNGNDCSELRGSVTAAQRTSAVDENRGFTGHEMLDDFGLIHMNGRIYDPELGRFLSADPFVQVPEFSQNFNRYSYVLNNPLSMTDSSGYFIDWIVAGVYAAVTAVVSSVTSAVVAYGTFIASAYGMGAGVAGVVGGVIAAAGAAVIGLMVPSVFLAPSSAALIVGNLALAGYNTVNTLRAGAGWGDILRGAAVGFVTASISAGVLHGVGDQATNATTVAKATELTVKHVAGHAVLGGLSQEAMGGRFQDGFLSAAFGTLAMDMGLAEMLQLGTPGDGNFAKTLGRTAVAGIVGGTAAEIGGGKFANGAYTAA